MFADPITITIASVAKVMGRLSSNGTSSVYATVDGLYTLSISHQLVKPAKGKNSSKIRSLARLDFKKVVADPLTAVNDYEFLTTYAVSERPEVGFTSTELKDQLAGFNTWHALGANQDKLFARES